MNPNVNAWNSPVDTGLTVKISIDGTDEEFIGAQALSLLNKLQNNPDYTPVINPTTHVTRYIMPGKDCTWCVMATVTPTTATGTPLPCEDGLPKCADSTLNPTTPVINIVNGVEFVAVGSTATLNVDTNEGSPTITWASADSTIATVANGVVTGVKVGTTQVTATLATGEKASATINVIAGA